MQDEEAVRAAAGGHPPGTGAGARRPQRRGGTWGSTTQWRPSPLTCARTASMVMVACTRPGRSNCSASQPQLPGLQLAHVQHVAHHHQLHTTQTTSGTHATPPAPHALHARHTTCSLQPARRAASYRGENTGLRTVRHHDSASDQRGGGGGTHEPGWPAAPTSRAARALRR